MRIYIYNENCVPAGHEVMAGELERYAGDIDDAGDWKGYDIESEKDIDEFLIKQPHSHYDFAFNDTLKGYRGIV